MEKKTETAGLTLQTLPNLALFRFVDPPEHLDLKPPGQVYQKQFRIVGAGDDAIEVAYFCQALPYMGGGWYRGSLGHGGLGTHYAVELVELREEKLEGPPSAAAYEEVLSDHNRLVRKLDVLINGEEGAAKQASLCDIVSQVAREKLVPGKLLQEAFNAGRHGKEQNYDYWLHEREKAETEQHTENMDTPRVTITGKTGSGKSALAYAIRSALEAQGISVQITGAEDEPPAVMAASWKGRLQHLEGRGIVTIETVLEAHRAGA